MKNRDPFAPVDSDVHAFIVSMLLAIAALLLLHPVALWAFN